MNRQGRIVRNPRVVAHHVEGAVWGLYHLDRGTSLFIDELSWKLLDLADSFASLQDLSTACQRSLGDPDGVAADLDRRIGELVEIEALLPIRPPQEMEVLLVDPPCSPRMMGVRGPAKGLCYLSQALREHGLPPARILDLRSVSDRLGDSRAAQAEYFAHHARRCAPGIVGITAVSATIDNALFIAQQAKLLFPEARIVLGGPHASYEWEPLLAQFPWIDFVVLGEGEIPFPLLVERVSERRGEPVDFSDVPGIAWRNAAGEAVTSGWCHGLGDLDRISFPDDRADLLNAGDYEFGYPRVLTGRGCPFKCSFCSTATFTGRRLRQRSVSKVVEEVLFYWRTYGARHVTFDDDIFTVRRKRTLELCAALSAAECAGQIEWGCNTRMDCIDEELIDVMHRAGCRWILFGIESGDAQVQQRFGKGRRSLVRFREKLEHMIARGIEPQLNFILGLPGENRTSLRQILSLTGGLHPMSCAFNFLNVFPGTPLADQLDDLGIRLVGPSARDRYSLTAPTLSTPTMSSEEQTAAYLELQWTRKRERAAWENRQGSIAC